MKRRPCRPDIETAMYHSVIRDSKLYTMTLALSVWWERVYFVYKREQSEHSNSRHHWAHHWRLWSSPPGRVTTLQFLDRPHSTSCSVLCTMSDLRLLMKADLRWEFRVDVFKKQYAGFFFLYCINKEDACSGQLHDAAAPNGLHFWGPTWNKMASKDYPNVKVVCVGEGEEDLC